MNLFKLEQLRSKTNRQLIALISSRLDAGSQFVRSGYHFDAERVYEEARVLFPLVDNSTPDEKQRLEARLTRFGKSLQQHALLSRSHVQTAVCL